MKSLDIVWQRLVKDGQTCDRCGSTQQAVQNAVATLRAVLLPLGIEPALETTELDEATFQADTLESNRITIAGKPLEYWIGGTTGSSECCSVCGTSQCRTVEVSGVAYEAIPEALIVKAALRAAAELTESPRRQTGAGSCGCTTADPGVLTVGPVGVCQAPSGPATGTGNQEHVPVCA
jgi:hypothetical protein